MSRIIAFVGYSNGGKTSLIIELILSRVARGERVAAIKHTHHDFPPDSRGDTDAFLAAGASEVLLATDRKAVLFDEKRSSLVFPFHNVNELPALFSKSPDALFIEGFKRQGLWNRILVDHSALPVPPTNLPAIVAVVTDRPSIFVSLTTFAPGEVAAINEFLDKMPA